MPDLYEPLKKKNIYKFKAKLIDFCNRHNCTVKPLRVMGVQVQFVFVVLEKGPPLSIEKKKKNDIHSSPLVPG